MTPREREMLTGMGNCYEACGADFEGTIGMVANARRLAASEVKETLNTMSTQYGQDPEYLTLRARLPRTFPF